MDRQLRVAVGLVPTARRTVVARKVPGTESVSLPMPTLSDFDAQPHTHARGRAAESSAETWLRRQGYRIVGRNYRSKVGEIDLIAYEGDILCFLEIKARRDRSFGSAAAQLTDRQRRRIVRAATLFVAETGYRGPCRFDLLALDGTDDGGWEYTLLRGAFEA